MVNVSEALEQMVVSVDKRLNKQKLQDRITNAVYIGITATLALAGVYCISQAKAQEYSPCLYYNGRVVEIRR